jgi:hypothetical protein
VSDTPVFQVVLSCMDRVDGWDDGTHWRVEIHDHTGEPGSMSRPIGVAYLTMVVPVIPFAPFPAVIDFLTIFEPDRPDFHAVATLMRAIRKRFPGILHTGRLGRDGQPAGVVALTGD